MTKSTLWGSLSWLFLHLHNTWTQRQNRLKFSKEFSYSFFLQFRVTKDTNTTVGNSSDFRSKAKLLLHFRNVSSSCFSSEYRNTTVWSLKPAETISWVTIIVTSSTGLLWHYWWPYRHPRWSSYTAISHLKTHKLQDFRAEVLWPTSKVQEKCKQKVREDWREIAKGWLRQPRPEERYSLCAC